MGREHRNLFSDFYREMAMAIGELILSNSIILNNSLLQKREEGKMRKRKGETKSRESDTLLVTELH